MMSNGSSNQERLTNFDDIEGEKENILPLRDGRSAQGLSRVLNEDDWRLDSTRLAFERRLLEEVEDLDDPLELFMEYINWINHAYPQGGTSKKSGMIDVLERCLMYFRDMETYKNDPRLLKAWLWYIELSTADANQDSKDIFIYMVRKRIGTKLSLFYESFAASLFDGGKFREAHVILRMGVEENARPQNRLLKRLDEYETKLRMMSMDPSITNPSDRRFLESSNELVLGRERSSLLAPPQQSSSSNQLLEDQGTRPAKHDVFRDDHDGNESIGPLRNKGWDLLDSRANRSKENEHISDRLTSESNLGKINQEATYHQNRVASEKLPIFKDSLGRSDPVYKLVQVAGKKPEKIDCNFNLIYPSNEEEFCIEEILAISRKVYHKSTDPASAVLKQSETPRSKRRKKQEPLVEKRAPLPSSQPPLSNVTASSQSDPSGKRADNIQSLVESSTSILPLRNESEDDHTDHEKIKRQLQSPHSPTVTYFSKNAMEEVYSMFNQHYQEPKPVTDGDETTGRFGLDNITQDFTRQNLEDLTEVKRTDADGNTKTTEVYNEDVEKDIVMSPPKDVTEAEVSVEMNGAGRHTFMTPIQERNERPSGTLSQRSIADDNGNDLSEAEGSSPFLTQPQLPLKNNIHEEANIIEEPLSNSLRAQLLAHIRPPLDEYGTFYRYNQSLKMSALLKRIHRVSKSENKNPIVDFKKTGDLYCIRAELGEGGYATVYLAESSTGGLKALKVEKPASVWEFYILKQIEKNLKGNTVLRSIINASSLHCFQDESYLVLNYANQGTVLDLVNLQKEKSKGPIDELLCMFITVELMKVVEAIHSVGIIHGDLKPDNCMIRFESGSLGPYQADRSEGWSRKGIYLIDFGRSFDMSLFEPGTKFKANWKTDQQDCLEMRKGMPWSYEADYFGLAGIIHSLLFGEFIDTVRDANGRLRLRSSLKRYWKQEIWSPLFDALINSNSFDHFPITSILVESRLQIEAYLGKHSTDSLKSIIRDLETELTQVRRGTKFNR